MSLGLERFLGSPALLVHVSRSGPESWEGVGPWKRALALSGLVVTLCATPRLVAASEGPGGSSGLRGVVSEEGEGEAQAVKGAYVWLSCACLPDMLETTTDARGRYAFEALPAGNYSVTVITGEAWVTKITQLPRGVDLRMHFGLEPPGEGGELVEHTVSVKPAGLPESEPLPVADELVRDSIRCAIGWVETRNGLLSLVCRCEPPSARAFALGRSLFDGGRRHWIEGGPQVTWRLF